MFPFFRSVPFRLITMLLIMLGALQASSVVVATSDGGLLSYLSQPVIFFRSYLTSPNILKVLAKPDGSKVYVVSNSSAKSITILKPDFTGEVNPALSIGGITNAWLTPDGSRLLAVTGSLRVFDTSTDQEITPQFGYPIANVTDLAISPDSKTVYSFSGTTQTIYVVDLTTNKVLLSVPAKTPSASIQVAPNGLVYLASGNLISELDPVTLQTRGTITFSGQPGKLLFSADSTRAFAANSQVIGSTPVLIYDLVNRTLAGGAGTIGTTISNLTVLSPTELMGVSGQTGNLNLIPVAGGASTEPVFSGATGSYSGFVSLFTSEEAPSPRGLFLVQSNRLIRIDLASNKVVSETPINATGQAVLGAYLKGAATGAPSSVIQYGNNQSIVSGSAGAPIGLRVLNANGQPLGGVPVTFSSTSTGPILGATSAVTNPDGYAYTTVTAPQTTGTYTVTAVTSGTSSTFTLTVVATQPPPGGGGSTPGAPTIVSGNGQITFQSSAGGFPLIVAVKDSSGKPMPNVKVTWAVTQGSIIISTATTTYTDQSGQAQVKYIGGLIIQTGASYEKGAVTATTGAGSVSFSLITLANTTTGQGASITARLISPPDSARSFTGKVGQTLTGAIQVLVQTTFFGQTPLPGVGIDVTTGSAAGPTVQCSGGTALTDSTGLATCNLVIGGSAGNAQVTVIVGGITSFVPIPLTAQPADVAQISPLQGDQSTGNPGQAISLLAQLKDAAGNSLSGKPAQWSVVTPGSATLSKTSDASNSQGQVSTIVTLGTVSGPIQIKITSGSASYTFTINVNLQVGSFTKVSGDNQSTAVGGSFANPLVVKALDNNNQPIVGAAVNFAVTSGVAFLSPSSTVTDTTGTASVTVSASTTPGPVTVTATLGSQTVTFSSLTVLPPGPTVTGFYDVAGFQSGLTPGALVRMVGQNLAPGVTGNLFGGGLLGGLPLSLNGVTVQIGGIAAPIYAISNINNEESVTLQVPFEVPAGPTTVVVTVNDGSTTLDNVQVSQYLPGIFMTPLEGGTPYGVVMRPDGSFVSPTNPAQRGETLKVFVSGIGPVSPSAATNTAGVGGQEVQAQMIVGVNHAGMRVLSAEYAQYFIGVYVITFELDSETATGVDRPLQIAVRVGDGTINSNETTIAIQ